MFRHVSAKKYAGRDLSLTIEIHRHWLRTAQRWKYLVLQYIPTFISAKQATKFVGPHQFVQLDSNRMLRAAPSVILDSLQLKTKQLFVLNHTQLQFGKQTDSKIPKQELIICPINVLLQIQNTSDRDIFEACGNGGPAMIAPAAAPKVIRVAPQRGSPRLNRFLNHHIKKVQSRDFPAECGTPCYKVVVPVIVVQRSQHNDTNKHSH